ncbi:GGDEF domain-containing protein [Sphingomonas ginkgonis]|uniref:GGDEF domain-containing protein n=1 Tax=Sphingomonas ginkgonis TaxID=2315330 RepID=A0A429V696_9SPHN|nr:GGDEF domain-containing protein [Sphingomonas ginkgonis]RST29466.1 GGDEF domain-containing protein [Sphingomonas ginkgonis]
MIDVDATLSDPATLQAELARLRGEVARLERRIEELDRLAHHDSLTPLPNRRGFTRQLGQLIARVQRYGDPAAVLFIDLDGLKLINDSFGHPAGDAALLHVAELLTSGLRQSDVVARFGGDEFAVLLDHADRPAAEETAARLIDRVAGADFNHDGSAIPLSVCIGIAVIEDGDTAHAVIARADQAMYEEKAAA